MFSCDTNKVKPLGSWRKFLLLLVSLFQLTAVPALAAGRIDDCVADRSGAIDGFVHPVVPTKIRIDLTCATRNVQVPNLWTPTSKSSRIRAGTTDFARGRTP